MSADISQILEPDLRPLAIPVFRNGYSPYLICNKPFTAKRIVVIYLISRRRQSRYCLSKTDCYTNSRLAFSSTSRNTWPWWTGPAASSVSTSEVISIKLCLPFLTGCKSHWISGASIPRNSKPFTQSGSIASNRRSNRDSFHALIFS
jgi:hypothetical protein